MALPCEPKWVPSYANLFVGFVEKQIFEQYAGPLPDYFGRHIDDSLGTASCSCVELEEFINFVNEFLLHSNSHGRSVFAALCSEDEEFHSKSLEMKTFFVERGYPSSLVDTALSKAMNIPRLDTLRDPVSSTPYNQSNSPGSHSPSLHFFNKGCDPQELSYPAK